MWIGTGDQFKESCNVRQVVLIRSQDFPDSPMRISHLPWPIILVRNRKHTVIALFPGSGEGGREHVVWWVVRLYSVFGTGWHERRLDYQSALPGVPQRNTPHDSTVATIITVTFKSSACWIIQR